MVSTTKRLNLILKPFFLANLGHQQSQFRFDNECNISLPDNHKRVSEAPALDLESPPPYPDSLVPYNPEDPTYPEFINSKSDPGLKASQIEDPKSLEGLPIPVKVSLEPKGAESEMPQDGSVVVKEDWTPQGLRLADEARDVAAAHAAMLVDVEACKRVSMTRCLR